MGGGGGLRGQGQSSGSQGSLACLYYWSKLSNFVQNVALGAAVTT